MACEINEIHLLKSIFELLVHANSKELLEWQIPLCTTKLQSKKLMLVSFLTFDLYVWPWPLGYKPESSAWHTVTMPWTFMPSYLKIPQCIQKLQSGHEIESFLTFDLYLWPWPLGHKPESCAWHTVTMPWTFLPGYFKIPQCIQNLQSGHDIESHFWPLTFMCDLDLWETSLGLVRDTPSSCPEHFCQVIWKSFHAYRSYSPDTKLRTDGRTDRP